ncbi:hypothetical protein SSYRP_v1c01500 [Spiroplasma syrphidicola EA-1]|uniref:Uncharacterized protein n=1 Tax=Spiroplasma syrphidicola EA-1 TaxID=1276229 RepID=R4UKF1_9MOLU|nr:hypothetical protein [Spiroplasma syrphidicola]AGM25746.1 hypothetical protein SSYRP_v1c01500 [Spiroplasma syrphidicola EA-1]
MKNLLSLIGTSVLGITAASPLAANSIIKDSVKSQYNVPLEDTISASKSASGYEHNDYYWTFKVDFNPTKVQSFSWSSSSSDSLHWGGDQHTNNGGLLSDLSLSNFKSNLFNKKLTDSDDLSNYRPYKFNYQKQTDGWATCESMAWIGFTYYYENSSYYLQVVIGIQVDVRASFSTANHTINTGSGFIVGL